MSTKLKSMPSIRAAAAREYSWNEEFRRPYRDGFTEGWEIAETRMRERLAKAVNDLMNDDGANGGYERGMRALAKIAGVTIPALDVKAPPVDVRDIARSTP